MMFDKIRGQDHAIGILKSALAEGKLSHSYLFLGPNGIGKFTSALYFAMALNCLAEPEKRPCGVCLSCIKTANFTHPDLLYLFPTPNYEISVEGSLKRESDLVDYNAYLQNKINTPWKRIFFEKNTGIRVDAIRFLLNRINLSRNEGRYKVFIIEDAEQLNIDASNAFLKTLEEPPNDVVIILTSSKSESLLQTIKSRCQRINFHKLNRHLILEELTSIFGEDVPNIQMISRIADGNMERAISLAQSSSNETRTVMKELVGHIKAGDDMGFISFADNYRTSKTVGKLIEIIQFLIIFVGDIGLRQYSPEEVVNVDMNSVLEEIVEDNPVVLEHLPELVSFLEEMLKRLEGYVNPHLVLIEIYNRMKGFICN